MAQWGADAPRSLLGIIGSEPLGCVMTLHKSLPLSLFSPPSFSLLHGSLFPSIPLLCSLHNDGDRLALLSQGALRVWLTALPLNLNLPFVSVAAPSFVSALPCSPSLWVSLHFKSILFSTCATWMGFVCLATGQKFSILFPLLAPHPLIIGNLSQREA